jgi:hypothetical protein
MRADFLCGCYGVVVCVSMVGLRPPRPDHLPSHQQVNLPASVGREAGVVEQDALHASAPIYNAFFYSKVSAEIRNLIVPSSPKRLPAIAEGRESFTSL